MTEAISEQPAPPENRFELVFRGEAEVIPGEPANDDEETE